MKYSKGLPEFEKLLKNPHLKCQDLQTLMPVTLYCWCQDIRLHGQGLW